jgi:DNA-binding CsgD family transcriptional regulator
MKQAPHTNLWDIPSVKHRHFVKRLVRPLYETPDFGGFVMGLVLKSGNNMWLSSTPRITINTVSKGLSKADILLDFNYLKKPHVIYPSNLLQLNHFEDDIHQIMHKSGLYRGYCYSKYCDDCCIIIGVNITTPLHNIKNFYQQTIHTIEAFSESFFDNTKDIFIQALPELKVTRFMTDIAYRHRILTTNILPPNEIDLNENELAILYWTARGKSASEISTIIGLTKNTVDSYRRSIINKCDVNNITEAVYFALSMRLIV